VFSQGGLTDRIEVGCSWGELVGPDGLYEAFDACVGLINWLCFYTSGSAQAKFAMDQYRRQSSKTLASAPRKTSLKSSGSAASPDAGLERRATGSVSRLNRGSSRDGETLASKPSGGSPEMLSKKPSKSMGKLTKTAPTGLRGVSSNKAAVRDEEGDDRITPDERERRKLDKKKRAEMRKNRTSKSKHVEDEKKRKKKPSLKDVRDKELKQIRNEEETERRQISKDQKRAERLSLAVEAMQRLDISPSIIAASVALQRKEIFKPSGEILSAYEIVEGDQEIEIEEATKEESNAKQFVRKKRPPSQKVENYTSLPPTNTSDVNTLKEQLKVKETECFALMNTITEYAQQLAVVVAQLEAK